MLSGLSSVSRTKTLGNSSNDYLYLINLAKSGQDKLMDLVHLLVRLLAQPTLANGLPLSF